MSKWTRKSFGVRFGLPLAAADDLGRRAIAASGQDEYGPLADKVMPRRLAAVPVLTERVGSTVSDAAAHGPVRCSCSAVAAPRARAWAKSLRAFAAATVLLVAGLLPSLSLAQASHQCAAGNAQNALAGTMNNGNVTNTYVVAVAPDFTVAASATSPTTRFGTAVNGALVITGNVRWTNANPPVSGDQTALEISVNGTLYARFTSSTPVNGSGTSAGLNGATVTWAGITGGGPPALQTQPITITLPISVQQVTSLRTHFNDVTGVAGDDWTFGNFAALQCSASLALVKAATIQGDGRIGAEQFTLAITGSGQVAASSYTTAGSGTAVTGGPATLVPFLAGTAYGFQETISANAAYYTQSYTCTNAAAVATGTVLPTNAIGGSFSLNPVAGDNITCTFTNRSVKPRITVSKVSNGGVGTFAFTGDNGFANQSITTATAGIPVAAATQILTAAGTATTITEPAPPAGFALTAISCTGLGAGGTQTPTINGTAGGSVLLDAAAVPVDANIACTFTNTRLPTVTVTKVSNAGVGTFAFTGTNGFADQNIETVTAGTGVAGATQMLAQAATATTITESAPPAGFALTAINCTGLGAGGTQSPTINGTAGGSVLLDAAAMAAGSAIACTFTNTLQPTLALAKTWVNATTNDTAALTASGGTGSPTLNSTADAANETDTGTPVRMRIGDVVTLGETLGGGNAGLYNAGAWNCSAGSLSGNVLTLDAGSAGADITCTIVNTRRQANLQVTKTATPSGTYLPGQPLSYSITVTNPGPDAATGITVTDTVPADVTVTAWSCTANGAGADCDTIAAGTGATGTTNAISLPSVALGVGESLSITVTGTAQLSATGAIVNTVTATPPASMTCATPPCSVSATVTNTDAGTPQLTLTKNATPASFAVGQAATYTLQLGNTGTSSTVGTITISDPLPAGITTTATPTGTSWDCSTSTATQITCTTPTVFLPGSNAPPISVPVTVASGTASPAVNTATASGGGDATCPAATHCQGTTTTPVNAPLLDLTKTLQGNLVVGVPASYVITVTNNGQADTLAGTITDTIPTGLTLGTLPVGCTATGQNITCQLPAGIAPGGMISYTIPFTPQASASGQAVTNGAQVSGGGDPSCPAATHCQGTTTDTVDAPQLSIVKTASGTAFVIGVPASYTLQVTNTGTAATTAVTTISDTIPTGLTIGTLPADCAAVGQVVTCTIAAGLATGTPVSFTIPVTAQASLNGAGSVTNNATATGGGDPSCPVGADATTLPARCLGTTTTAIDAPRLDIVKTASGANFVVGVEASYTLQVTNNGTAATTQAATVSDTIPADLVIGTLPANCSRSGQVVTCMIAAGLATGTSVSFVIPVTPTAAASGQTLSNTATVSGGGDPTCPGETHCTSTTTTPVDAPALTIVKSASGSNFVVGVAASYTLQVTNTGTAAATAIATISDTIPGTLTIGTLPAGCTNSGQAVTCTIPAGLAIGASVSFVIPVTPQAAASGTTVSNTATVSGGGDPTCPAATHCTSTTNTPVDAPQLTVVKTASGSNFVVGVQASYTLQVTNTGTAATTQPATVSDTIPGTLTIGTPLPADCVATGQTVTCTIAAGFATGAPVSFVIPVTPTAAASGTTVTNTANVSGGGDPTCPGATHCSSTVDVPVNAPQLTMTKTASAANFVVGVPATYTLQVTNTGSAATTAVATISDTIPASLTPGAAPTDCTITGQTVSCTIPAGLAIGASVSFTIPVTPTAAASGTTVSNTATVSGGGDPTCPADTTHCSSTVDVPVNAPQLTMTKTASAANFVVGVPASYTLQVTNTGSAATTAVATISDTIPASLTPGAAPTDCTITGQTVTCTIAAGLAIGASVSFTIPVTPTAAASGTTVSNTATVSGGGDPTCPADTTHCSSTVDVPVNAPQLTIAKTASVVNFVVGVPASYTLQVTNTGSAATTVVATTSDTIPASLTPGAAPTDCTITGQTVTCTIAAGLATGASVSFVIPVTPTAAASGTTVSNTATVSGGGDPTCPADTTHCSSTVNVPVNAPQLTIAKTASATSFVVGVPASYTLQVTNTGSAATTADATVSDTVPASLTLGTMPAGCTPSGQVVTCTIPAGLAVGANVSFVIPVTPTVSAVPSVTNTATVSGGGDPTCPADTTHCSSTVDVPVGQIVNLVIAKTATPSGRYLPGASLNYGITVTNNGPSAASGIRVSDTVPANVTVIDWACTATGATADCDANAAGTGANGTTNVIDLPNVSLGVGESLTIAITGTAQISATGAIVNTATAEPPTGATCTTPPCSVSSTVTNTDGGAPQLTIAKTATPGAFAIGQSATYSLQVSNTGSSSTAGAIVVNDPLPAGITTTALPSGTGWDCSASTATQVSCTSLAVLLPGSNAPVISVPVTIGVGTASPAVNTATTSGGGDASCPADATHCASTTTTPVNAPRLDVTKVLQGSFVIGMQSTYLITVTNNGQADTLAGTITDTIPTGLAIGTLPIDCTAAGQNVTCAIPAGMSVGTSVSFAIPVTPQASVSGQSLTNNAVAHDGGDPTCPAESHCTGTTTDTVDAPQLQIVKTATPTAFVVGAPASYTLTVTNTGTAATTAVATVTDTVPTGLTIGALPAECAAAGQVLTCTIPAPLATGTPVTFTIPVTPTAALNGLSVTNNAGVRGGGDPSCPVGAPTPPARCDSRVTTPINAPQLTIAKTASAANFVVGQPASYTLQVTNTGSAATTADATVSDPVPADLTIGAPLPVGCAATGQTVTCTIASGLAVGANVSFVIPATPTAAASGQTLSNTATVIGGGDPSCPGEGHCTSTVSVPVDAPRLTIAKTASSTDFVVDQPANYTLQVTNTGSAATTAAATVSDTVPGTLTLGTLPADCVATGQTITCTIPAGLAVGASVSFVIPVTPTAAASGTTVSNTATVSGGGDPTCPADTTHCSSTVDVPVDAPNLRIVKTATPASFTVGQPASYTLTVTNSGVATMATATVTDPVPAGLTVGSPLPADCTAAGQTITCTIAAGMPQNGQVQFVIPVTATAAASGTVVSNTATVGGGGDPGCPVQMPLVERGVDPDCSSTVDVPVDAPLLNLVKTASDARFTVGVPASYTLTVTSAGPVATTAAATVTDPVPAGLELGVPLPADCAASGQTVTCTIAAGLAPNANVAFTIPVTPSASVAGTTLSNTATVNGGGDPSCPAAAHCSSTVDVPVDVAALAIVKTASAAAFTVGVPASYTLTVTNNGAAGTTEVTTIEDPVPVGLDIGTLPAGCTATGQTVTCTIAAGLAVGASVSFQIPVTPTAAVGATATNTATIISGDPSCPAAAHCSSTVDVPVGETADLQLTKTDGGSTVAPGRSIVWTLTASNLGPSDAIDVVVSDPLPTGLTFNGAAGEGWSCAESGGTVTCTRPALANGASATITLTMTVPPTYRGPNPIVNTAAVTSTTPDPNSGNNTGTDPTPVINGEPGRVPALGLPALLGLIGGLAMLAQSKRRRGLMR